MQKIFRFFKSMGIETGKLKLMIVIYFGISLLTLSQPEVLRRATAAITSRNMQSLVAALIFAAVSAVLFISLSFFRDIWLRKSQNYYEQGLSKKMLKKLTNTKMKSLGKKKFGDVSTSIIRNVEFFISSSVETITDGSSAYFALILTFTYMCLVQWQLALCVLVYNLVIRFFAIFVEKKIKKNTVDVNEAMKKSGNELASVLKNILTVKIYSNKDFFKNRVSHREKAVMKTSWKSFVWSNGFQDFIWAFSKLAEFVIVYGVGAVLIYNQRSDVSVLMTFVFANDLFTIGINSLSYYMQVRSENAAYKDSIMEILGEAEIENEEKVSLKNEKNILRFKDVSFSYDEKTILSNVSFSINVGEKILLKGPNGQGKSTILKLICGLYRPESGEIFYGDKELSKVNISSISEVCGYISQHSNILEGDVLSNLALSHNVDKNMADNVLKELNLADSVTTPPQNLSMGEKQRLNIGRSLYRGDYKILLCDEIFSNIDKNNRLSVIKLIEDKYKDSTVIMISHEDIPYGFDRVLKVENGTVREVAV